MCINTSIDLQTTDARYLTIKVIRVEKRPCI